MHGILSNRCRFLGLAALGLLACLSLAPGAQARTVHAKDYGFQSSADGYGAVAVPLAGASPFYSRGTAASTPPPNVYPNPAKRHFFFKFAVTAAETVGIRRMNAVGETVLAASAMVSPGTPVAACDLQQLVPGIYFFQIRHTSGQRDYGRICVAP
jgi:hypothetical protein